MYTLVVDGYCELSSSATASLAKEVEELLNQKLHARDPAFQFKPTSFFLSYLGNLMDLDVEARHGLLSDRELENLQTQGFKEKSRRKVFAFHLPL